MTKNEIQEKLRLLSSESSYPSLSITFKVNPEDPQYEYKLNQHLRDARAQLQAQVPASSEHGEQVRMILEQLDGMTEDLVNFGSGCRGYGIFLSASVQTTVCLPFEVDNQITIADSFQVRELAYNLGLLEEYLVLLVSEHKTLALRGFNDSLSVVQIEDLPASIDEMGTYTDDTRFTHMSSAHRGTGPAHQNGFTHQGGGGQVDNQEHLRNYMVRIDQAVGKYLRDENLRFVLMGTEKKAAHFLKASKYTDRLIGSINGNYDHLPSHEIGKMAAQVVQDKLAEEREGVLDQLQNAVGQNLYVAGIQSVWQAAFEGRVRTLIVEKGYQCKAVLKENGYVVEPDADSDTDPVAEDAVDDLIEMVINKGGNVIFTEDGKLEGHQQLAAITRY
jgi:hypothetical protein